MTNKIAAVVLGAGKGSRMKSDLPKVMMPVCGKPMIRRIMETLDSIDAKTVVIVAPDGEMVVKEVAPHKTSVQNKQLGTGHAVLQAKEHLDKFDGSVLVVFGDTPIITKETFLKAVKKQQEGYAIVVVGVRITPPPAYGRLIMNGNNLEKIVEFKDANEEEKKINLLNSGMMVFDGNIMFELLDEIKNNNAANEYYLTDAIEIAINKGLKCSVIEADAKEVASANTLEELALLEQYLKERENVKS